MQEVGLQGQCTDDSTLSAEQEAELAEKMRQCEESDRIKDDRYHLCYEPFRTTVMRQGLVWTITAHDQVRECLWSIARQMLNRDDGQRAINRRNRHMPPKRLQLYWMGGEPGVIPEGVVYPFGDRNKQQSVFELTENKNLDSDMMGTIFELAYAALRAAKITIPDGIGAWAVICKYRLKDWISEHRDNDYYCNEFPYIVSFTACGAAVFKINPKDKQNKHNVPELVADDTTGWMFTQTVKHEVPRTKTEPRINITARFGALGTSILFKIPDWFNSFVVRNGKRVRDIGYLSNSD